jgi:purine-nucleoside phosphorylase
VSQPEPQRAPGTPSAGTPSPGTPSPGTPSPGTPSAGTPSAPIHLQPTAALAERVLLPDDPGRALALAQTLMTEPKMFNHHRGLWGYSGPARVDGAPLTIQSTGIGGPSAAIVLSELVSLGARRAIRVGTCAALGAGLALGEIVVAREAICLDGASRALGAGARAPADAELTGALLEHTQGARAGAVASVDLFYDAGRRADIGDALAVDLESAALFVLGAASRMPVASLLAVSDTFDESGARARIEPDSLRAAAERMGAAAVAALAV